MTKRTEDRVMRIAVVIPCYKVTNFIVDVVSRIGPEVERIYAVDDCCPEGSGDFIESHVTDSRVRLLRNPVNKGVGGAVMTGYRQALEDEVLREAFDRDRVAALLRLYDARCRHDASDRNKKRPAQCARINLPIHFDIPLRDKW